MGQVAMTEVLLQGDYLIEQGVSIRRSRCFAERYPDRPVWRYCLLSVRIATTEVYKGVLFEYLGAYPHILANGPS